jgi:hypothetical protein
MEKKDKRPMKLTIGDTAFEKIQAFYINPELYPLSDAVEKIRQRWITIVTWQLKVYPKHVIANMLERDFGISPAQAYADIRNAENIFGNIIKSDNEAFNSMWLEWTKDYLKRSRINGDRKSEGKALDLLAKYGGLDAESPEFNPEKLENKEIKIVMDPKLQKMLFEMVSKGVADFNSLNVTDVDFDEVK